MVEKTISKVIFGGKTLIDLTGDTVTAEQVQKDAIFHDKTGAVIIGTSTKDSNTQDATVTESEILSGKIGYARGNKVTGTMPNRGAFNAELMGKNKPVTIP